LGSKRKGIWAGLLTEQRNPRSRRLDELPTSRIVSLLLDEDRRAILTAASSRPAIIRAVGELVRSLGNGGKIVFLGAGTSGRLGVLEAAECPPTFGSDPEQIRGVMAGGPGAVFHAVEGAEDSEKEGRREGLRLRRRDVLIGISASSVTPFVRTALKAARRRGARTILLTCSGARGLESHADVVVNVPTGPEILTGSTRLKAGSATKAVLNALTTAAMVRLGKVYENLMVDLKPTSAKLEDRARRVVSAALDIPLEEAARRLKMSGAEVKTAIVSGLLGISPTLARRRIRAAHGHLRRALARPPGRAQRKVEVKEPRPRRRPRRLRAKGET